MSDRPMRMREKIILRVVSRSFIPFVLLFGCYVQFHGDFGPGGGFQAGVIVAAGVILFSMIFGLDAARQAVPTRWAEVAAVLGVLLYGGVGALTMGMGGNFLEYGLLDGHDPVHGQHLGILLVELGVGITVTAVMILIYYAFAGRAMVGGKPR